MGLSLGVDEYDRHEPLEDCVLVEDGKMVSRDETRV